MASVWAESLSAALQEALGQLASAVEDCPEALWQQPMWPEPLPGPSQQFLGRDWRPITDSAERQSLAQRWSERRSTPWSIAWHALEVLDYDLSGERTPWAPPPPFTAHPHWRDLPSIPQAWSQQEILGYVAHCRSRIDQTFAALTEEQAAAPLPQSHRYSGEPHARILTGLLAHSAEHAAQLRQFITSRSG